jgi:D-alanyl-D-alanine carboxypeptidase
MRPEHVHGIASVSKTFIAALLLDLQGDGRIDLDDRVDRWLPDVAVTNDATVRQLLNHRSGIADVGTSSEFIERLLTERDRDWTALEQLEYLGPPHLPAGAGFRYSNTNYLLAGLLIEAVTGRSAAGALQEILLAPNGLDRVVLQGIGHPAPEPVAHGLFDVDEDGDLDDLNDDSGLIPFRSLATVACTAGGIATDAPALARWADALYGGRILGAAALSEMLDFRLYPYGLGVQRDLVADEVAWGHDGDIGAFRSSLRYLDRMGISIAVLTNDSTIDPATVVADLAAVAAVLAP